jgi:hypothetical protein
MFERLLQADFPGKDRLVQMLREIQVRTIDEDGGLELRSQANQIGHFVKRIPVEAEATDEDGFTIHVLLHVEAGRPVELEIYKDDGSRVKSMPNPASFQVIVFPA